jgi:hypothetical protein
MTPFKFFRGYDDVEALPTNRHEAFAELMNMFNELDTIRQIHRGYELPDDVSDWDNTLSDGLGEE